MRASARTLFLKTLILVFAEPLSNPRRPKQEPTTNIQIIEEPGDFDKLQLAALFENLLPPAFVSIIVGLRRLEAGREIGLIL